MIVYLNQWNLYYHFDFETPNQFYWHNRGTVDDYDKLRKHLEVIINLIFFLFDANRIQSTSVFILIAVSIFKNDFQVFTVCFHLFVGRKTEKPPLLINFYNFSIY